MTTNTTRKADLAGAVGIVLAAVGMLLALAVGFDLGGEDPVGALLLFPFDWTRAALVGAPFVVAAVVAASAGWIVAAIDRRP